MKWHSEVHATRLGRDHDRTEREAKGFGRDILISKKLFLVLF